MSPLDGYINDAAEEWDIDPAVLRAVAGAESGPLGSAATSKKGAQGTFQIMGPTAAYLGVTDPRDDRQAAYGAAKD